MAYLPDDDEPLPPPSEEEVRARVADWKTRIGDLFRDIEAWGTSVTGVTADRTMTWTMSEPFMEHYDVPPEDLPVLTFSNEGEPILRFVPEALWVLGANGRVYIASRQRGYRRLVDMAEPLSPPRWVILGHTSKLLDRIPVDRSLIIELLRAAAAA